MSGVMGRPSVEQRPPLKNLSIVHGIPCPVSRNTAEVPAASCPPSGYIGGELEFPQYLYLAAEVSNKDAFPHIPFAVGLQWRHPQGDGLSLAGIQTGTEQALCVGIGIAFR